MTLSRSSGIDLVCICLCAWIEQRPPAAYDHTRYERDTAENAKPEYDICIIGAGVVGASLATVLGRTGYVSLPMCQRRMYLC